MKITEIENLKNSLKLLSGVGEKTAKRYAFDMIDFNEEQIEKLIEGLKEIKKINECSICGNYTIEDVCDICLDDKRDDKLLIVVSHPKDILKIEEVLPDKNYYFSLGGVIDPLNGVMAENLRLQELKELIEKRAVKDVLFALPVTNEGEITASYLKKIFKDLDINFSRIAQGVPIGSNLEFLDEITLMKSIQSAQKY